MKFYSYIQRVIDHLDKLGVTYTVKEGTPVDPEEIKRFESLVGVTLPLELKNYFDEVGNGFMFSHPTGRWYIEDFSACIEEWGSNQDDLMDAELKSYYGSQFSDEILAEGRKRRKWLPIYGFGCGGYTINYDCEASLGEIRYHDIRDPANISSARIASSLEEWMDKWSRYCFTPPSSSDSFESHLYNLAGDFPWPDVPFPEEFCIDQKKR